GIDDQKVCGGVAKEEVLVSTGDFFDVFKRDAVLFAGGFLGDAGAQHLGAGLEIDDQIGSGKVGGGRFVVGLGEFELLVVEIDVGKDAVFLNKEIGQDRAGSLVGRTGEGLAKAALALEKEVHLRAESGTGLGLVKVSQERIVLTVQNAAGMQTLGED